MKNYRLLTGLVVCCGFGLMLSASTSTGATDERVLTNQQLEAIVRPGLHTCESAIRTTSGRIATSRFNRDYVIPAASAREFSVDRIKRNLNGVWRGVVEGDHGEVNVDYFWIIDVKREEGLIIAQRSGSITLAKSELKNPPTFSFLMCANDGYTPALSSPQMHVFTKVSHDIDNAVRIVEEATGVKFPKSTGLALSDLWEELVSSRYFENLHQLAFGGGLFKPLEVEAMPGKRGPNEVSVRWDAEYRGGGETLLEFEEGAAIIGTESAQFVATTTASGDFLVASPGNGDPWKVETVQGATYNLEFQSTSFGPLQ